MSNFLQIGEIGNVIFRPSYELDQRLVTMCLSLSHTIMYDSDISEFESMVLTFNFQLCCPSNMHIELGMGIQTK